MAAAPAAGGGDLSKLAPALPGLITHRRSGPPRHRQCPELELRTFLVRDTRLTRCPACSSSTTPPPPGAVADRRGGRRRARRRDRGRRGRGAAGARGLAPTTCWPPTATCSARPANFGYMSGALKHFFDTIFLEAGGALTDDGSARPRPAAARSPTGCGCTAATTRRARSARCTRSSRRCRGARRPRCWRCSATWARRNARRRTSWAGRWRRCSGVTSGGEQSRR